MESTYSDFGITIPQGRTSGQITVKCPKCSYGRKAEHRNNKDLSINLDQGVWQCHHCHETGSLRTGWKNDASPIVDIAPKQKLAQQFYPEPAQWSPWGIKDAMVMPAPPKKDLPCEVEIDWYFRNIHGKLCFIKNMAYYWDGHTFKRVQGRAPSPRNTGESGFYPCLYNEFDLTEYPKATVILVEAEKTAGLLRYKFKNHLQTFIFLAVSGANGLTTDKSVVLKGRKILICYDCDQAEKPGEIKGRDGAELAYAKLKSIADPKIIDIDPTKTDGTDLADIIDQVDIDYLTGLDKRIPPKLQQLWDESIVKVRPPARIPLISIQNIPIATRGNHSLIIGKKKSRKSLFIVWLLTEAIKQGRVRPDEIIAFDTEQDREDVYEMHDKVWRVTNSYTTFFSLRGKSHKERREAIADTIASWPVKPQLIVIDGIRDLMSNINDPDESTDTMTLIERLTTQHNIHIIDVLHLNKTDSSARGHIGTELLNKSEMNIELTLDEKTTYTEVKCESSRRHAFQPFMFTHAPNGLPEVVGQKIGPDAVKDEEQRHNLRLIFEDGDLGYSDLIEHIKQYFKVGTNKAGYLMGDFRKKGWLIKVGTGGTKDSKYHYIGSNMSSNGNGHHHIHSDSSEIPFEEPDLPWDNMD